MVDLFLDVRDKTVRKKPATAELVAMLKVLEMNDRLGQKQADVKKWYRDNLTILVKTREDIMALENLLKG